MLLFVSGEDMSQFKQQRKKKKKKDAYSDLVGDDDVVDMGVSYDGDSGVDGYRFERPPTDVDLTVAPISTSKDEIEQPALAAHENMYIPPLGSSVVISGKSGSGKSTLLANLLNDGRFYGPCDERPEGWFDKIFLFSPTANGDDIQKSLNIPAKYVFTDLEEAPELLDVILNSQQEKLDKSAGAHKVAQYAIIFDDVIGDTKFMNKKSFTRCFYQVRHVNCTTFICTQHFRKVPKICRLQANFVFFFQGSAAEVEVVTDEYAPPSYSKNEFRRLVNDASCRRYTFLTINMKLGWDHRFRRNLDEFIKLDRLQSEQYEQQHGESDTSDDCGSEDDRKDCEEVDKEEQLETAFKFVGRDDGTDEQDKWDGQTPCPVGGRSRRSEHGDH